MTIQEAINELKIEKNKNTGKLAQAIEIVASAAEKQVGRKVVLKDKKAYCWEPDEPLDAIHCPGCDAFLAEKPKKKSMKQYLKLSYGRKGQEHCEDCGQKLEWSEK